MKLRVKHFFWNQKRPMCCEQKSEWIIFIQDQWTFISIQEAPDSSIWNWGPLEWTGAKRQIWHRRFVGWTAKKTDDYVVGEEISGVFLINHTAVVATVITQSCRVVLIIGTLCLCWWSEMGSAYNAEWRAQHESKFMAINELIGSAQTALSSV